MAQAAGAFRSRPNAATWRYRPIELAGNSTLFQQIQDTIEPRRDCQKCQTAADNHSWRVEVS